MYRLRHASSSLRTHQLCTEPIGLIQSINVISDMQPAVGMLTTIRRFHPRSKCHCCASALVPCARAPVRVHRRACLDAVGNRINQNARQCVVDIRKTDATMHTVRLSANCAIWFAVDRRAAICECTDGLGRSDSVVCESAGWCLRAPGRCGPRRRRTGESYCELGLAYTQGNESCGSSVRTYSCWWFKLRATPAKIPPTMMAVKKTTRPAKAIGLKPPGSRYDRRIRCCFSVCCA